MLVKRGFIFLIFLLLVNISYAQDSNQCLLVNENNVGEAAERIWNTFSSLGLENALSAVDSLKLGDNGYEFKEEIKEELRRKTENRCNPSEEEIKMMVEKVLKDSRIIFLREKEKSLNDAYIFSDGSREYLIEEILESATKICISSEEIISLLQFISDEEVSFVYNNLDSTLSTLYSVKISKERMLHIIRGLIQNIRSYYGDQTKNDIADYIFQKLPSIAFAFYTAGSQPQTIELVINSFYNFEFYEGKWRLKPTYLGRFTIGYLIEALEKGDLDNDGKNLIVDFLLDYPENVRVVSNIEFILSNHNSISPEVLFGLMQKNDLFLRIYNHPKISNYEKIIRNTISLAVFRDVIRENEDIEGIERSIDDILKKREIFGEKIILGGEETFIAFAHEEGRMIEQSRKINDFASNRKGDWEGIVTSPLQGMQSKETIKEIIAESRGKTVIWPTTHGSPSYLCLARGTPDIIDEESIETCEGFRFDEFGEILLERGDLDEVTLIISQCYGYDFAENLLNYLKGKSKTLPTIITAGNKGKSTVSIRNSGRLENVFFISLQRLSLSYGQPLLGKHVYEAEEVSYNYQDIAVFFSEMGDYKEIALNSFNHDCPVCEGDSCPINIEGTET